MFIPGTIHVREDDECIIFYYELYDSTDPSWKDSFEGMYIRVEFIHAMNLNHICLIEIMEMFFSQMIDTELLIK